MCISQIQRKLFSYFAIGDPSLKLLGNFYLMYERLFSNSIILCLGKRQGMCCKCECSSYLKILGINM